MTNRPGKPAKQTIKLDTIELLEIAFAKRRLPRFIKLLRQWIAEHKAAAKSKTLEENRITFSKQLKQLVKEKAGDNV